MRPLPFRLALGLAVLTAVPAFASAQQRPQTQKPSLHARHWIAITGKPLGATAGAMMFARGGNAVDAACAMLAAVTTMWDVLSWGGETQALIYHPRLKKVIGIDALGVAPTGATAEFYRSRGHQYPPEYGPLAAVTPGTPGGLMTMLAEYGTLSLAEVLGPAIQMADGYPIEAQTADGIEAEKARIKQWKYSTAVFLPHLGAEREAPVAGEIFVQRDLAATLRKLVEAERKARQAGKSRQQAIYAAYERFYKGDIARELVRGVREEGGLITLDDLARWKVKIEEPLSTDYKGITVYKLPAWEQGPVMLQTLNILENVDLEALGYNSTAYIHTLYQAMNLAYADRDFYYGDPAFPPEEPVRGLLSKAYARARLATMNRERNDTAVKPGDPYPYQHGTNPFTDLLQRWTARPAPDTLVPSGGQDSLPRSSMRTDSALGAQFSAGTTSIEAADEAGWVVSVTPSGGWVPAVIAGRTGVGLSQRAQSFVTRLEDGPYNVIEPGKRPRVTLTPTLALKEGVPYLAFAVQGGDSQDQPAPVLPRHRRVRNDAAAGRRGAQHLELPDALFVRGARVAARRHAGERLHARQRTVPAGGHGLCPEAPAEDVGTDQWHPLRPRARHDVGRLEQLRRGLRDSLVSEECVPCVA
jgi:gamma-glutamyltranspeptidase/glutathione hydrolase